MQRIIQVAALAIITTALTSCGFNSNPEQQAKASEQQVKAIEAPIDEACQRKYVSVKKDTFEKCLIEGLSYIEVANTLGYPGTLMAQSGNAQTWQWNGGEGKYLTATFIDDRMLSKSQINLE